MRNRTATRLALHRETLRRLDPRELASARGGNTTLTLCPECATEGGCGGGGGGSTLSCTQFVCVA